MEQTDRPTLPVPENPPLPASGDTLFDDALTAPFDVDGAVGRLARLRDFFAKVMEKGIGKDYGPPFPGSKTLQLYTGGADKLCQFYGVYPRPRCVHRVEQWGLNGERPFLHFEYEVDLISYRSGKVVAVGLGSCNSLEAKYRYRKEERKCPDCGVAAIFRSKFPDRDTGKKGWYCNRGRDGCGAQFPEGDPAIEDQEVGRVENLEVQELHHTILRIAIKRAKVHGVAQITSTLGLLVEAAPDADGDGDGDGDDRGRTPGNGRGHPEEERISEAEQKALVTAWGKAGHKAEDVGRWLKATHDVDLSRGRLPKRLYQEVLARVSQSEPLQADTEKTGDGKLF